MSEPLKKEVIFIKGSDLQYLAASHEDPSSPGVLKKVLFAADCSPSGKLQMVNWASMPVEKSFQRHYHEDMTEVFIVVKGQAVMQTSYRGEQNREYKMNAGDGILIPDNFAHQMFNIGLETVEYIVFGISQQQGGKTINC